MVAAAGVLSIGFVDVVDFVFERILEMIMLRVDALPISVEEAAVCLEEVAGQTVVVVGLVVVAVAPDLAAVHL